MTIAIDICVCTFRRDSLAETLASIARQAKLRDADLRVIVADNDDRPERRAAIEAMGEQLALSLTYIHAPARNISVARNACLRAATGAWVAFIDDDEVAEPDWCAALLAARHECDVVFGVSQATYAGAPPWLAKGDFHSNRIGRSDAAWNGYTANVLIRHAFVERHRLRFLPALGETGGEDTLFFLEAHLFGARFGYAPQAIVTEATSPARATLTWLLRRRFRAGQIHYLVLRRTRRRRTGVPLALVKAVILGTATAGLCWNRVRATRSLLRAVLQIGVVASALGVRPYREYRVR